ncbi:hypothetical protein GZH47_21095 [Paenibacillus rhizovicinus]|uniref:Lipoprotein n=1 Tax=Paenibacillus rhizovicinus TaxID=2704463 RepID=A0A6C0P3J4_9BACL|nr:hypothetical protein [Paenibacillus rhizovicinus]QHW33049.1 hypothetical protein GZH47_21095 [Paenibacillus rhizovicinus]
MNIRMLMPIAMLALPLCLAGCSGAAPSDDPNTIAWQGKGVHWEYGIKLVHKPNDQVTFISHGQNPAKPCEAPDYAVEISEGFIYTGKDRREITSFEVAMNGIPSFLPTVSTMSQGGLNGLEQGAAYGGMSQNECFTKAQWEHMRQDTSNTYTISVKALPSDDLQETFSLQTAN